MNKAKHLFIALMTALLALPLTANADETHQVQYLIIEQNSEKVAEFELSTLPVLTYTTDSMVVACNGDSLLVPLEAMTYYFETRDVVTGINNVPTVNNHADNFAFSHGTLMGLKAGAKVGIYSSNGMKVSETTASAEGNATLRLGDLPKGIYIIKTPARSFKIINR